MKLKFVATVKTNQPHADFWLVRKGTIDRVGKPTKMFYEEHIGIKVTHINIIFPQYLYYVFMAIHQRGEWEQIARGTLNLKHITVSDVQNIGLSP